MSKHAPGPWTIERNYSSDSLVNIQDANGEGVVFSVPRHSPDTRLIAAAPDLLSVARFAETVSKMNIQDPMQLILLNIQLANLGAVAKMALAKAEGEKS